jgi:hypothetical protein
MPILLNEKKVEQDADPAEQKNVEQDTFLCQCTDP